MKPELKKLWKQVDEILWEDWDPIGINDCAPRDEYENYVPSVVKLVLEKSTTERIASLLHKHASENMGLSSEVSDHIDVAKKLQDLVK